METGAVVVEGMQIGCVKMDDMEIDGMDIDHNCTDTIGKEMCSWSNYKHGHAKLQAYDVQFNASGIFV